jgi:hypothetical protein
VLLQDYTFDLIPLAAALQWNTYFKALVMKGIPRKEAAFRFAVTVEHNTTLRRLVIRLVVIEVIIWSYESGMDCEEGFVEIGNALKKNPWNVITELDVSHNPIKEKGLIGLSDGIYQMQHLYKVEYDTFGVDN